MPEKRDKADNPAGNILNIEMSAKELTFGMISESAEKRFISINDKLDSDEELDFDEDDDDDDDDEDEDDDFEVYDDDDDDDEDEDFSDDEELI